MIMYSFTTEYPCSEITSCAGWTKLMYYLFIELDDPEKTIRQYKDDLDEHNNLGWTALHIASRYPKHQNIVELLLSAGVNIHAVTNKGWTPLHEACLEKGNKTVFLLLSAGANVNTVQQNNWTPLHVACQKEGNEKTISLLLSAGANVNTVEIDNWTPLHLACQREGNEETLSLLLSAGANVTLKTKKGRTAFDIGKHNYGLDVEGLLLKHMTEIQKDNIQLKNDNTQQKKIISELEQKILHFEAAYGLVYKKAMEEFEFARSLQNT